MSQSSNKLEKPLFCLTCEEKGDDQPKEFWKRTILTTAVDKDGRYTQGPVPVKKEIAYICSHCEDLVRLLN